MKKIILIIILSTNFLLFGQNPAYDPHWQLVWEDDFNTLNTSLWEVINNCDHGGEPQLYKTENVYVTNGNLVLKLQQEYTNVPTSWCNVKNIHYYTSGEIESKQNFKVQYGYIEAKIKLPVGNGFWPAFWLWSGAYGDYEEIDIFEMVPGRQEYCDHLAFDNFTHNQNFMTTNIHSSAPSCEPHCNCDYSYQVNLISDYTNWHTYAIEWTPNKIIFYVDGKVVRNSINPNISNFAPIILNLALNPYVIPYYSSNFPAYMYIDYVKVYELKNDCYTSINLCTFDFDSYDNKVKKDITIGGGCSNAVSYGSNITLRAVESIKINGDFFVPVGAELYLDVNGCY